MSQSGEIVINNLLCFLSTAKSDHSTESLSDIAYSFYSHEEIKLAKTELANTLKKDIVWRRDPDKKRKDLNDVLEYNDELIASKKKIRYVSDNYKKMPPVGLELIAPILIHLSEEVERLNEFVPKILDIKSEVLNSADTIRQMRVDISDVKANFNQAVKGLTDATHDIAENDLEILSDVRSFRLSISEKGDLPSCPLRCLGERERTSEGNDVISPSNDVRRSSAVDPDRPHHTASQMAFVMKEDRPLLKNNREKSRMQQASTTEDILEDASESDGENPWTLAGARRRQQRLKRQMKKQTSDKKRTTTRVIGNKKSPQPLRGVKRTADVFLGRMYNDVSVEEIKEYIKNNVGIDVQNIVELEIVTDKYKAYKVSVYTDEREKFFDPDLWPEGIIVDKYYSRSKTQQ